MIARRTHILHVGKTGGSALSQALSPVAKKYNLLLHGHDLKLADVPLGENIVFLVRNPINRFISGFNSRLRKGMPRNCIPWTPEERVAFSRFSQPSSLAEGLDSSHEQVRLSAYAAMDSIYHPARHLSFWLKDLDYLTERRLDVAFIGCTEHLDADFKSLLRRLAVTEPIELPRDEIGRHATPAGFEQVLQKPARAAIERWYRDDLLLYDRCLKMRTEILTRLNYSA